MCHVCAACTHMCMYVCVYIRTYTYVWHYGPKPTHYQLENGVALLHSFFIAEKRCVVLSICIILNFESKGDYDYETEFLETLNTLS